jgi:hypothetical protein
MHLPPFLHDPFVIIVAGYILSAAANAMPSPDLVAKLPVRQIVYMWLHEFAQGVVANLAKLKTAPPAK